MRPRRPDAPDGVGTRGRLGLLSGGYPSGMSDHTPTFSSDIRPLFRDGDISSMSSFFDLSAYDDVREHANEIYARLADGSMPCDGAWPNDQVATFKAWIDAGTPA